MQSEYDNLSTDRTIRIGSKEAKKCLNVGTEWNLADSCSRVLSDSNTQIKPIKHLLKLGIWILHQEVA
jgi:hypothetical protein